MLCSIVFENKSDLSIDVCEDLENLTWLIAAVILERRDPAAVSVGLAASASYLAVVAHCAAQAP